MSGQLRCSLISELHWWLNFIPSESNRLSCGGSTKSRRTKNCTEGRRAVLLQINVHRASSVNLTDYEVRLGQECAGD